MSMIISGYDDDNRELWAIEEVKNYVDLLDRCSPYWFFFAEKRVKPGYSTLTLLIGLIVPFEKIGINGTLVQTCPKKKN